MVKNIFIYITIAIMFATTASAVVPPSNIWGYIFEDGNRITETIPVSVSGDCYGTGESLITEEFTQLNIGYYDLYIPMDDSTTPEDEGCATNQKLTILVDGNPTATLIVGNSGSSSDIDLHISTGDVKVENTGGGDGGGSGGGGSSSNDYPDIKLPEIKQETVSPLLMSPPFNVFGYAYIDGTLATDSVKVRAYGDCFGNGEELLAEEQIQKGLGYYDIYIPMDTESTEVDEGCLVDQPIRFTLNNQAVTSPSTLKTLSPGSSIEIDLVIGEEGSVNSEPELEEPTTTGNDEEQVKIEYRHIILLILVIMASALLSYQIHKKNEKD